MDTARHRPRFSTSEAVRIAADRYGLGAKATILPSDRDQNFLLFSEDDRRFVLKFASSAESREVLDAQLAVLSRLKEAGLPVPDLVADKEGRLISEVEGRSGRHYVWMLSYLEGVPFATAKPKSSELMRSLGQMMGRLSAALDGFDHPGAHRSMRWDLLEAAETVRSRLHLLEAERRQFVERFLRMYDEVIAPHLDLLRRSVVHNDANDYNVLVNGPAVRRREVVGLIDFGDLVHSVTVSDIAVAAAYAILDAPDPLDVLGRLTAAYHREYPLQEREMSVVLPLIGLRLSTSVCISAEQRAAEPDNEYLSISQAPAWRMLERLAAVHPRFAEYVVREACGLEACPRSRSVIAYIKKAETAAAVEGVERAAVHFDFSVASSDWSFEELTVPRLAEDRIAELLQVTDPPIGIGRYNEVRIVYEGDQFAEGEERRTVHIGIDLFAAPGTNVRAPIDARVHSVADNDRPYDYGPTVILKHDPEDGPAFYTLYGHLSRSSITDVTEGAIVRKGEAFAQIGSGEENGGWAPHLHFQLITDLFDRSGEYPGVASASRRGVWTSVCPDPSVIAGLRRSASAPVVDAGRLEEQRREHIGPSLSISYKQPVAVARGRGQYLYDANGRRFLDTVNNVAHVGHAHPRVAEAAVRRMRVLNTNTRYLYDELTAYAVRLVALLPDPLSVCYLVNSGSEANDLALRIARAHTGRKDVVVLDGAYHGNLTSLIEVSPYKFNGPGGCGRPSSTHVAPMPDVYRGIHRGGDAAHRYGNEVAAAADRAPNGIAAFLAEPAMSCGGQIFPPAGFLSEAFQHIRARGGVCIADEVQTGFGRVGKTFWAFELQDAIPDIVTLGKPIGNGHPLGAVVTTKEIALSFDNGMEYFNTFGGNPVSCAIGSAVLEIIEQEDLQAHAHELGSHFIAELRSLAASHPVIGDVRGSGLFIGVEFVRDGAGREPAGEETGYVVERMREKGILTSLDGPMHNVLKIKPPLVIRRSDTDRYVETLDEILKEDFVRARVSG